MKCNNCGLDREGRSVEIVVGNLLPSDTKQDGILTTNNQTFGEFEKVQLWFCQECWRSTQREEETKQLIYSLGGIGFGVILVVIGLTIEINYICALGILLILAGLVQGILSGFKRLFKNYSKLDIQLADPISILVVFKNSLPSIVYRLKGETYFWEGQNWQDWKDNKPNLQVTTLKSSK